MGDAAPPAETYDEAPAVEGGALDDLAAMAKESAAFALELARPTLEAIQKDPTQAAPWVAGLLVCMRQRGFNRVVLLGTVAAAWTSLENVELIEGVAPEHVRLAVVALLALLPALGRRKGHPERLGAAGAVRSPHHAAHRRRLVAFYEQHAPEKINDVDAILAKYLGREEALFARLEQKYAAPSPARASPARASPARAAPSPATAPKSTNKKAHDAKQDARAAMEARLNARLARKK